MIPPINLLQKFGQFDEFWTPKILGEFNGQLIKIAKLKGEFVWHAHAQEDELFYIVNGSLEIKYRTHSVTLCEGEIHIVPRGTEHYPIAKDECWVMLIEPKGTAHTGSVQTKKTVDESNQEWI